MTDVGSFGSGLLRMLSRPFLGGGPRSLKAQGSVYGKLPIYKDFIRRGLADPASQAFKQWLDHGMSRFWEGNDASRDETILPHSFVVRFPGTGRVLLGHLWGSSDQGGLRKFPFAFFVAIPAGMGAMRLAVALDPLAEVERRAEALRREARELSGIDAFYQRYREIVLDLVIDEGRTSPWIGDREYASITLAEFASSLWGEGGLAEWVAAVDYVRRHVEAHAPGDRRGSALAIRVPVSPLVPVPLQVEVWSAILERAAPGASSIANLFLPQGEREAGFVILLRDLRPEDVFVLNAKKVDDEQLEDLRRAVPRGGGEAPRPRPGEGDEPLVRLLGPAEPS